MSTVADKVKIIIGGDASGAEREFKKAKEAAKESMKAVAAAGAAAAASLAAVEGAVIRTSSEFERYNTQLTTIEGSQRKANAAMGWITDFTKTTPYELNQVTESFVRLRAYGIDPTDGTMQTLGDTAAAMGKPLMQAVEAMADAMTGENERLKEFGIKAKVNGDQIAYNWVDASGRARTSITQNNAEMIESTLNAIWNEKYAGGMNALSQTWDGMTSNLSDNWTIFKKNVGDNGAFQSAKNVLGLVLDELNKNDAAVNNLSQDLGQGLVTAMQGAVVAGAMVAKGFEGVGLVLDGVRVGVDTLTLTTVEGFDLMLSAADAYMSAVKHIPGAIGRDAENDLQGIRAMRDEMASIKAGIVATGAESLTTLTDNYSTFGDKVDEVGAKVFAALEAGREAANTNLAGGAANDDIGGSGAAPRYDAETQALVEKARERFETMRMIAEEYQMSEEEKAITKFDEDLVKLETEREQLIENNAWNLEQQMLYEEAKAAVVAAGNKKVAAVRAKAARADMALEKAKNQAILAGAKGALGDMASLMNTHSRAAFELGKAAAIANATVSGISAAVSAWEAGMQVGGPYAPLVAIAYTAASLAKTGAMISSLASTQFNSQGAGVASGGGVPNVGGGGTSVGQAAPTAPQAPPAESADQNREPSFVINVHTTAGLADPIAAQMLADSLAPHIQDSQRRGLGNAAG